MLIKARYIFLKKKLAKEELEKCKSFYKLFPELRKLRYCNIMLRRIFRIDTLDEAKNRYEAFINNDIVIKNLSSAIKKLKRAYDRNELFTYLNFDKTV